MSGQAPLTYASNESASRGNLHILGPGRRSRPCRSSLAGADDGKLDSPRGDVRAPGRRRREPRRESLLPLLACGLLKMSANFGEGEGDAAQERAIVEIQKLGGVVQLDETQPGRPVVNIYLEAKEIAGADLVDLEELTRVQGLALSYSIVTDAGLAHLEGLTFSRTWGSRTPRSPTAGWRT